MTNRVRSEEISVDPMAIRTPLGTHVHAISNRKTRRDPWTVEHTLIYDFCACGAIRISRIRVDEISWGTWQVPP